MVYDGASLCEASNSLMTYSARSMHHGGEEGGVSVHPPSAKVTTSYEVAVTRARNNSALRCYHLWMRISPSTKADIFETLLCNFSLI